MDHLEARDRAGEERVRLRRRPLATRDVDPDEAALAREVFGDALRLDRVRICDAIGIGGRPWVSRGPRRFKLRVGPTLFATGMSETAYGRAVLVHELTHVWQGQTGLLGFGYMAGSVASQAWAFLRTGSTSAAYEFEPGLPWHRYSCEQQANLVETWVTGGMRTDDALFPYIRDHIRRDPFEIDSHPLR